MLRVAHSLSFGLGRRLGADPSTPVTKPRISRISDFLHFIIPSLANFLMPHGPEGCPDKQALFYLLLALVHVEHLCERLTDKNPYLRI